MKYKLLKDLPLAKAGTEVEISDTNFFHRGELDIRLPDDNWRPHCIANIKLENKKEWLEEVKEPKTIYDLKYEDTYFAINYPNKIVKYTSESWSFWVDCHTYCFLTEREAKRNKLLRELATRTDKWLPEKWDQYYSYHLAWCDVWSWQWDNTDMIKYHYWLVFRNREEYSRWLTEYAKDLLFNI